jgi:hypothetical protein
MTYRNGLGVAQFANTDILLNSVQMLGLAFNLTQPARVASLIYMINYFFGVEFIM